MNKLKILVFVDFPSPYRVEILKGLNEYFNLKVYFDKLSDQNRSSDWFCKNDSLNSLNLLDKEGKAEFEKDLKNIKNFDLVIAYDYHIKNAIYLQMMCILKRVPYIMNCDGAFIRKNFLKNILKRILISKSSGFFVSGKSARDYFIHFGAAKEDIFTHPFTSLHSQEILKEPISDKEKIFYRSQLQLEERKTVISIGQFIYRKGFDVLLNAWGDLDGKYQLIIIGGGMDKDNYIEIIREKKYRHVKIIDFVPKEKVFNYLKASDIFVFPTREDVWGLVINESLANGVPVISSNMCLGALEMIENSKNGYIVPVGNSQEIHDRIQVLIENVTEEMKYNCLKSIKDYTYENVINSHILAIEKILRKHSVN